MPNHTANCITISGPEEDLERFLQSAKSLTDESLLAFTSLVPMPTEIRNTSCPVRIQTQPEIDSVWEDFNRRKEKGELSTFEQHEGRPLFVGITCEHQNYLLNTYGCDNWYDWALRNWGTKWDCYSVGDAWERQTPNSASIYYETAWETPTIFWKTVSKQYPKMTFLNEFADEGGGFLGREGFTNGEMVFRYDMDWESDDGINLRQKLGRYDEYEEEI